MTTTESIPKDRAVSNKVNPKDKENTEVVQHENLRMTDVVKEDANQSNSNIPASDITREDPATTKTKKKRQRWKKKRQVVISKEEEEEEQDQQKEEANVETEETLIVQSQSKSQTVVVSSTHSTIGDAMDYQMDETNCEALDYLSFSEMIKEEEESAVAVEVEIEGNCDKEEKHANDDVDDGDADDGKEILDGVVGDLKAISIDSDPKTVADPDPKAAKTKKHRRKKKKPSASSSTTTIAQRTSNASMTTTTDISDTITTVATSAREMRTTKYKSRTYQEELEYLEKLSHTKYRVHVGFVPNMIVPADVIVNQTLEEILLEELHDNCSSSSCCGLDAFALGDEAAKVVTTKKKSGGFIPALKQMANVAALPGIVKCLAMPDVHSGYGFCIGNVAAFDMDDDKAVISPGGVGFDINCGVRLLRTNLKEEDVMGDVRERIAQAMFDHIPVGVGTSGVIPVKDKDIDDILEKGIDWAIEHGYAWQEDKEHCEERGRMMTANKNCVSSKAKKRGLHQIGTLGGGNHYAEVQVVDAIYNHEAAKCMGIQSVGQVCVMIHTGSRGLGHQVATDALQNMDKAMHRDGIKLNDRQLSCARINSKEGKDYLAAMSAAANYAWVNRSCITYLTRRAFEKVFEKTPEELDMHLVYDVCHNVAKIEKHMVDGVEKTLLVHRKGSTRAFPPKHPMIPEAYQDIGQPALIGGTMGTCSYILVGTEKGMSETFGSTCHGAGRALSRNASRKRLDHKQVLGCLKENNISIRVASPKLVTEEAPESYKDVSEVVDTCHDAGISFKAVKLRPIAVIKG